MWCVEERSYLNYTGDGYLYLYIMDVLACINTSNTLTFIESYIEENRIYDCTSAGISTIYFHMHCNKFGSFQSVSTAWPKLRNCIATVCIW